MSAWPWFPFFVDDFLASPKVRRMSGAEVGCYVLLLCEQWQVGYVSDADMDELARTAKSPPTMIHKILDACFDRTDAGWVNVKLDELRAGQDAKSEQAKDAARARWAKKANADGYADAHADASSPHMRNACGKDAIVDPYPEPDTTSSDFEAVWEVCKRGSKRQARYQYGRVVPAKVGHEELLAAWKSHVSSASEPKYVKHLERWIRDERWLEQPATNGNAMSRETPGFLRPLPRAS